MNSKYEIISVIGEGSYGIVYKCAAKESGEIVAIKKFKDSTDHYINKSMLRELKSLKIFNHKNIINLRESFKKKGSYFFVFDYVENNLLEFLTANSKGVETSIMKKIIFQICCGLRQMHKYRISHRDIKPENILIDKKNNIKICDFGFARMIAQGENQEGLTEYVATRWYRAPELLLGTTQYGMEIDYWSVGCILGELIDGNPVFPGDGDLEQIYMISKICGKDGFPNFNKNNKFGNLINGENNIKNNDINENTNNQNKNSMNNKDLNAIFNKNNKKSKEVIDKIEKTKYVNPVNGSEILVNVSLESRYAGKVSRDVLSLLKRMLDPNPITRIKSEEIFTHEFFSDFNMNVEEVVEMNKIDDIFNKNVSSGKNKNNGSIKESGLKTDKRIKEVIISPREKKEKTLDKDKNTDSKLNNNNKKGHINIINDYNGEIINRELNNCGEVQENQNKEVSKNQNESTNNSNNNPKGDNKNEEDYLKLLHSKENLHKLKEFNSNKTFVGKNCNNFNSYEKKIKNFENGNLTSLHNFNSNNNYINNNFTLNNNYFCENNKIALSPTKYKTNKKSQGFVNNHLNVTSICSGDLTTNPSSPMEPMKKGHENKVVRKYNIKRRQPIDKNLNNSILISNTLVNNFKSINSKYANADKNYVIKNMNLDNFQIIDNLESKVNFNTNTNKFGETKNNVISNLSNKKVNKWSLSQVNNFNTSIDKNNNKNNMLNDENNIGSNNKIIVSNSNFNNINKINNSNLEETNNNLHERAFKPETEYVMKGRNYKKHQFSKSLDKHNLKFKINNNQKKGDIVVNKVNTDKNIQEYEETKVLFSKLNQGQILFSKINSEGTSPYKNNTNLREIDQYHHNENSNPFVREKISKNPDEKTNNINIINTNILIINNNYISTNNNLADSKKENEHNIENSDNCQKNLKTSSLNIMDSKDSQIKSNKNPNSKMTQINYNTNNYFGNYINDKYKLSKNLNADIINMYKTNQNPFNQYLNNCNDLNVVYETSIYKQNNSINYRDNPQELNENIIENSHRNSLPELNPFIQRTDIKRSREFLNADIIKSMNYFSPQKINIKKSITNNSNEKNIIYEKRNMAFDKKQLEKLNIKVDSLNINFDKNPKKQLYDENQISKNIPNKSQSINLKNVSNNEKIMKNNQKMADINNISEEDFAILENENSINEKNKILKNPDLNDSYLNNKIYNSNLENLNPNIFRSESKTKINSSIKNGNFNSNILIHDNYDDGKNHNKLKNLISISPDKNIREQNENKKDSLENKFITGDQNINPLKINFNFTANKKNLGTTSINIDNSKNHTFKNIFEPFTTNNNLNLINETDMNNHKDMRNINIKNSISSSITKENLQRNEYFSLHENILVPKKNTSQKALYPYEISEKKENNNFRLPRIASKEFL